MPPLLHRGNLSTQRGVSTLLSQARTAQAMWTAVQRKPWPGVSPWPGSGTRASRAPAWWQHHMLPEALRHYVASYYADRLSTPAVDTAPFLLRNSCGERPSKSARHASARFCSSNQGRAPWAPRGLASCGRIGDSCGARFVLLAGLPSNTLGCSWPEHAALLRCTWSANAIGAIPNFYFVAGPRGSCRHTYYQ